MPLKDEANGEGHELTLLNDREVAFELKLALLRAPGLKQAVQAKEPDLRDVALDGVTVRMTRVMRRAGLVIHRRASMDDGAHSTPGPDLEPRG